MSPENTSAPAARVQDEAVSDSWRWHRLRDIGFGITFWPFNWHFGVYSTGDFYGGTVGVGLGPFTAEIGGNAVTGLFGRSEVDVKP